MEQCIFVLKLIVEGTTEKVSQFIMPQMSIYIKMFCLHVENYIFEHCRKILNYLYNYIIHVLKIGSVYLFCAALSELKFVLIKDVLFH